MSMNPQQIKNIIEAALLAANHTLSIDRLLGLFIDENQPSRDDIRQALAELTTDYEDRGVELKEVSSGFRLQVRIEFAPWVARLWDERPPRYSRALLETLVLIAYKQPVTRGDIEDVRGVAVSSHIIKTLLEREWVRVLGHREVPGRPSLYGTTKQFLDYFNLKSLEDLPPLGEIKDLDDLNASFDFESLSGEGSNSSEKGLSEAGEANNGEEEQEGDETDYYLEPAPAQTEDETVDSNVPVEHQDEVNNTPPNLTANG